MVILLWQSEEAQPRHPFLGIAHDHHHFDYGDHGVNDDDLDDDDPFMMMLMMIFVKYKCYQRSHSSLDTTHPLFHITQPNKEGVRGDDPTGVMMMMI